MKNIKYILFTAIILMGLSSCDDWLKVYPENSQVTETFWTSKETIEELRNFWINCHIGCASHLYLLAEISGEI